MSTANELTVGSFLMRKSDRVGAHVIEHGGGSHDWYDLRLENGRTVTISASGIRAKYVTLTPEQEHEVRSRIDKHGVRRGTISDVVGSIRTTGHALMNEGAPFRADGERENFGMSVLGVGGVGRAKCSCGELSEPLPSSTKRRAWHRDHKKQVLA